MRSRIWLALLVSTLAQADRCDPPAQIVQFLTTLPDDNRERHKMIGERVKSSPNDFWLNRLFLDGSRYEGSAIRDRYLVWFETNRNIENKYLYGRSLVGFETKQALRVYSEILAQEPDNPWVHNSQIEIYRTPSFRDRSKLRSSFEAVTQTCPSWIEPYRYLTDLDDDSLPSHAAKLRTMLEQSTNPRDVRLYSVLWAAEFRLKQPNENTLIAADLKRLRAIDGARATIAAGARLIGDDALAREMSPQTVDVRQQQDAWQRSHPYPQPGDPPDKRRAYAQAALEASNRWIAEAPNRISSYWQRFGALEMLDAPAEQIAGAAEDVVRVARADDRASGPSYIAAVAQRYVDRGIQLDRVPVLIDEALTSLDDPEAVIQTDFDPGQDDINAENKMRLASDHVSALVTLSKYYEKIANLKKARSVLDSVPVFLAQHVVPEGVRDLNGGHNLLLFHALAHHAYWQRLAELDEHENKNADALTHYRAALLVWDGDRNDLLARQRRLWKSLGRSDEAWQAWVDATPPPPWKGQNRTPEGFAAILRPLPKAALKDLNGREWTLDGLQKTTIAVVWATWCPPCVAELPYLAKLADRLKDRNDVQVVSLNTDENPETAEKFVKQHGYQFPVLLAKNFAEDLMPYFSIPRTWIIRDGALVQETTGYIEDGDHWLDLVAAQLK